MATRLCTTYDSHRPALLQGVLPYISSLEVTPDSIAAWTNERPQLDERIVASLTEAAASKAILVHGVGLSIGTAEGMNETYLNLLGELLARVPVRWHSEHLGFTSVGDQNLNAMLPLPRTAETLHLMTGRINRLQDRFGLPFLIENIAHLIPSPTPAFSEAGFLNALTSQTGCGLILDVYNLLCDQHNYDFELGSFLAELDRAAVREVHIAGGTVLNQFWLDIHSDRVAEETLDWTSYVLRPDSPGYCPNVEVVTYEILPQAVDYHGDAFVIDEIQRLHQHLDSYELANVPAYPA